MADKLHRRRHITRKPAATAQARNFEAALLAHENILWPHVRVRKATGMKSCQPSGNVAQQHQDFLLGRRRRHRMDTALEAIPQGAFVSLCLNVQQAILEPCGVVLQQPWAIRTLCAEGAERSDLPKEHLLLELIGDLLRLHGVNLLVHLVLRPEDSRVLPVLDGHNLAEFTSKTTNIGILILAILFAPAPSTSRRWTWCCQPSLQAISLFWAEIATRR